MSEHDRMMARDTDEGAKSGAAAMTTLIFPAVNAAAVDYLRAAARRGEQTVCAVSTSVGGIPEEVEAPITLPMVYERNFGDCLLSLVREHSVARIYCPVATAHAYLRGFIERHRLPLSLVGESPVQEEMERHRDLFARARRVHASASAIAGNTAFLDLSEVAGLLKFASAIYGESSDDKLAAMMGVACSAPPGDVVEIGSLMGRSAFVLLFLAARYGLGPVLTVDPWMSNACRQVDSPPELQSVVDEWSFDVLSEGFSANTALFGRGRHQHLRLPSSEGFQVYAAGDAPAVQPPWVGRIGLIHIDGNHDYEAVAEDCRLWLSRMLPGGWLVLDDYVWAHGDGPFRVGNELLARAADDIESAFVCGKALYVRWRK